MILCFGCDLGRLVDAGSQVVMREYHHGWWSGLWVSFAFSSEGA